VDPDSVTNTVSKTIDKGHPMDLAAFLEKVNALHPKIDRKKRKSVAISLGRLLVYKGEIRYDPVPKTGLGPKTILTHALIDALVRLGDPASIPYLKEVYARHGKELFPELPAKIRRLGGSVREKGAGKSTGDGPVLSQETKQARRKEVAFLLVTLSAEDAKKGDLGRAFQRIGDIGGPEDVPHIVRRAESKTLHWVAKQAAFESLGKLGGKDAKEYLLEQLSVPVPDGADLDDYGDERAILKAEAALALGECGDRRTAAALTKIAADEKQFERVRHACRKAVSKITRRAEARRKREETTQ
jgi:hypothetical protein